MARHTQRVPVPAAQSRIDALTTEIDVLHQRRLRRLSVLRAIQAEMEEILEQVTVLRDERAAIYATCERVEIEFP